MIDNSMNKKRDNQKEVSSGFTPDRRKQKALTSIVSKQDTSSQSDESMEEIEKQLRGESTEKNPTATMGKRK